MKQRSEETLYHIIASALLLTGSVACTNVKPLDVDDVAQQSLLERDMKRFAEEQKLQKAQDESDAAYRARVQKMYDEYYAAHHVLTRKTEPQDRIRMV